MRALALSLALILGGAPAHADSLLDDLLHGDPKLAEAVELRLDPGLIVTLVAQKRSRLRCDRDEDSELVFVETRVGAKRLWEYDEAALPLGVSAERSGDRLTFNVSVSETLLTFAVHEGPQGDLIRTWADGVPVTPSAALTALLPCGIERLAYETAPLLSTDRSAGTLPEPASVVLLSYALPAERRDDQASLLHRGQRYRIVLHRSWCDEHGAPLDLSLVDAAGWHFVDGRVLRDLRAVHQCHLPRRQVAGRVAVTQRTLLDAGGRRQVAAGAVHSLGPASVCEPVRGRHPERCRRGRVAVPPDGRAGFELP